METTQIKILNLYDFGIVLLCALTSFFGYKRGLVQSLSFIISGIIGALSAQKFYLEFSQKFTVNPNFSFLILFVGISGVVILIGFFISKLLETFILGFVDRLLGVIFGFVLGIVIILSILLILEKFFPEFINKLFESSFIINFLLEKVRRI